MNKPFAFFFIPLRLFLFKFDFAETLPQSFEKIKNTCLPLFSSVKNCCTLGFYCENIEKIFKIMIIPNTK